MYRRSVLAGLFLSLFTVSSAWAYSAITTCDTETGGLCQRQMIGLEPGAQLYITVKIPQAACFPRITSMRVSDGPRQEDYAPHGAWVTQTGISFDGQVAYVGFYVQNSSNRAAMPLWLGFVWECERMMP